MFLEYLTHMNLAEFLVLLFLLMPVAAFLWFLISMILFLITPKASLKRRARRILFIVSGSIAGTLVMAVGSIVALFFIGLRGM